MKNILLICFVFVGLISCKNDQASSSNALQDAAEKSPATQALNRIKEINQKIADNGPKAPANEALVMEGLALAKDNGLRNRVAAYLTAQLRNGYRPEQRVETIMELAGIMGANKSGAASNILYKSVLDKFPDHALAAKAKSAIGNFANSDIHGSLTEYGEAIFVDPNQYGINETASQKFVDACEAYALSYNDDKAPGYLYKAAEIARSLRTFPKTLSLYDWIISYYPDYEKSATTMFLKGFVLENELKNNDLALKTYDEFLQKFPKHELADDVAFLKSNLGKSNDEILKLIEKNKEAKKNK